MSVVSISMPSALRARLDEFADDHGYGGRSEVVRKSVHTLLEEFQAAPVDDEPQACTVLTTFEYGNAAAQQRLIRIRHEHDTIVSASTHTHIRDQCCMELFVLNGTRDAFAAFINALRTIPDLWRVDYTVTPLNGEEFKLAHTPS